MARTGAMLERTTITMPDTDPTEHLRNVLGHFATGVTVITAPSEIGPLGFTANSFSSVSLEPPLVQWSLAIASRRHRTFTTAPRFSVHILGAEHAKLARHFSDRGDGFDAFDWCEDSHGVPILADCIARLDCSLFAVHPAGDHSIILGEVHAAELVGGDGLVFDQGRYGRFQTVE